jgi:hypothetical protein
MSPSEFLETYRILLFWLVDCVVVARGSLQHGFFSTGSFYGPRGIEGGVGGAVERQAAVAGAIAKINLVMRMTSIPFTKYYGTA